MLLRILQPKSCSGKCPDCPKRRKEQPGQRAEALSSGNDRDHASAMVVEREKKSAGFSGKECAA